MTRIKYACNNFKHKLNKVETKWTTIKITNQQVKRNNKKNDENKKKQ